LQAAGSRRFWRAVEVDAERNVRHRTLEPIALIGVLDERRRHDRAPVILVERTQNSRALDHVLYQSRDVTGAHAGEPLQGMERTGRESGTEWPGRDRLLEPSPGRPRCLQMAGEAIHGGGRRACTKLSRMRLEPIVVTEAEKVGKGGERR